MFNLFHFKIAHGVGVDLCLRRVLVHFRNSIVVSLLRQLRKLNFVAFFAENLSFICHVSGRNFLRLPWIKPLNKSLVLKVRWFNWANFRRFVAHAGPCIIPCFSWMVNNFRFISATDWRLIMPIIIVDRCDRALSLRDFIRISLNIEEMLMVLTSCQPCHLFSQTYLIFNILPFLIRHNMVVDAAWLTTAAVWFKLTSHTVLSKWLYEIIRVTFWDIERVVQSSCRGTGILHLRWFWRRIVVQLGS